jgi:microcystin-dependent protein
MQTIYLDISNKGVYPCIYAKQGDVGRNFCIIVTDSGVPFNCETCLISIWYKGDSGEGNYTDIGSQSAIIIDGNKITVSLIQQMLVNPGSGVLSLSVTDTSGNQIGLWNIDYCVEEKPGANSEEAKQYYDAFSKPIADLTQSADSISKAQKRIDSIIQTKNKSAAGLIYPLATDTIPSGFLLCDGAAYSRTEYSELFEAIGTTYGSGNGTTTFNVPNLSTRVPVGAGVGYPLGKTDGEAEHTLTADEMPSHAHTKGNMEITGEWNLTSDENNAGLDAGSSATGAIIAKSGKGYISKVAEGSDGSQFITSGFSFNASNGWTGETSYEGGDQPHNNMQPYVVVNYIISTGKEIEFVGVGADGKSIIPVEGQEFEQMCSQGVLVPENLYLIIGSSQQHNEGDILKATSEYDYDFLMNIIGESGQDGYTPVRGTDYWTEADKAEIIQSVLAALPSAEEVGF